MTSVNTQQHLIQEQPVPISDSLRGSEMNANKRWTGTTRNIREIFCLAGNVIQAKTVGSAGILLQEKALPLAGILLLGIHPKHPIFGRCVTRPKMGCLVKIDRNFCGLFLPNSKPNFQAPILLKQNPQVLLPTWNQADVLFRQHTNLSGKNHLQAAHSNQDQTSAFRAEPISQVCSLPLRSPPYTGSMLHSRRLA
ncbi:MAG: hypothetical protein B7Y07_10280 [Halothiobacillus sp. 24-54-40]|jgi:hypothetical protein|nr:MAG: hypothetical protein B7Y07_10280 [Halothiobacillus sp. 24-54-40]